MEFDGTEYNKQIDEKTMVEGLEHELLTELRAVLPGNFQTLSTVVTIISALIDAKIELNRVQMKVIEGISEGSD